MESLLSAARRILERHPGPALPFAELHRLLSREWSGPPPDPGFLLDRLRARRDLFRVLEPWRGPWHPLTRPPRAGGTSGYRTRLGRDGVDVDAWVVSAAPGPGSPWGPGAPPLRRLRETIRWMSRTVDGSSPSALCRWMGLVRQDRQLRLRLRSGAASGRSGGADRVREALSPGQGAGTGRPTTRTPRPPPPAPGAPPPRRPRPGRARRRGFPPR